MSITNKPVFHRVLPTVSIVIVSQNRPTVRPRPIDLTLFALAHSLRLPTYARGRAFECALKGEVLQTAILEGAFE